MSTFPEHALHRKITSLGVAEQQTSRARQVFERWVEHAGYFEHGKNRLVMPALQVREQLPADPPGKMNGGNGGGEPPAIDPIYSLSGFAVGG